jgi:hypothetical protein
MSTTKTVKKKSLPHPDVSGMDPVLQDECHQIMNGGPVSPKSEAIEGKTNVIVSCESGTINGEPVLFVTTEGETKLHYVSKTLAYFAELISPSAKR